VTRIGWGIWTSATQITPDRSILERSIKKEVQISAPALNLITGDHHCLRADAATKERSFQNNGNLCTRIRSHDNELAETTITEAAELARWPARAIRKLENLTCPPNQGYRK
jgi:hypothetical protein